LPSSHTELILSKTWLTKTWLTKTGLNGGSTVMQTDTILTCPESTHQLMHHVTC